MFFKESLFKEEEEIPEKIIKNFFEKAVKYLIENIIQKDKEFKQALSNEASDVINDILVNKNNGSLYIYVCEYLEKNISNFNDMIKDMNFNSFNLIENIINMIKIKDRHLIFECMNNLTVRFEKENSKNEKKNLNFLKQYFSLLNSFLASINKINNQDKEEVKKFDNIINTVFNIVEYLENYELYNELIEFSTSYIKCLNGINNAIISVLKKVGVIIEKEKKLSLICFNFITTFLSKIKRNIDDNEKIDRKKLFDEIIHIIETIFLYKKECVKEGIANITYRLLLIFQILSINMNLSESNIIFLINENINNIIGSSNNINQIIAANICLGLIYYTDITLNRLFKKNSDLYHFIKLMSLNSTINLPILNFMLNKCLILGIYKLFINITKIKSQNINKIIKIFLLSIIFKLIFKQKTEKRKLLYHLTKKEIVCNFIDEVNEGDDIFPTEINDFHNRIELALSVNDDIIHLDEFKLIYHFIKYIRKYDNEIYELYMNKYSKSIEDILLYRNVNIKYKEKEYIVGRKIIHLKRNN